MAALTNTVASIIAEARFRADAQTSTPADDFTTDDELLLILNKAYREFLDLVISCGDAGIELLAQSAILTPPYALPTLFYRIIGVESPDDRASGRWRTLKQYQFRTRNDYTDTTFPRWRLVGNALTFTPADSMPAQVQVWYLPYNLDLDAGDAITTFNGWDDLIVATVAAYICTKEDRDVSIPAALRQAAAARITEACANMATTGTLTVAEAEYQIEEIYDLL